MCTFYVHVPVRHLKKTKQLKSSVQLETNYKEKHLFTS